MAMPSAAVLGAEGYQWGANSVQFPVFGEGRGRLNAVQFGGSAAIPSHSELEGLQQSGSFAAGQLQLPTARTISPAGLRRDMSPRLRRATSPDRPPVARRPLTPPRGRTPPRRGPPPAGVGPGEGFGETARRPRVSLATWAGLEPSPGMGPMETSSGIQAVWAGPVAGQSQAQVLRPPLEAAPPLLPPRLNAMVQMESLGAVQDGPRPIAATTMSQGSVAVTSQGSVAMQWAAERGASSFMQPLIDALDTQQLLEGHLAGPLGIDPRVQPLHEVRALSPAPGRARLNAAGSLAAPPAHPADRPAAVGAYPALPSGMATPHSEAPPRPLLPAAPPLTVALDVDEVLCRYVDGFRKWLQRERPAGPLDTDSVFREAHDPNSPWRLQFAMCGGLDNLEAVPGAPQALRKMRQAGMRLEVVTSRPPIMRESTEALLGRLFPPDTFSAAHFVGPGEKGRTCNAIRALALVDDQIPNITDAHACGVVAVLFNFSGTYPWSCCGPDELPPGVMCLESWAATSDYLLSAFGLNGNAGPQLGGDYRAPSPVPSDFRRPLAGERRATSPVQVERRQLAGLLQMPAGGEAPVTTSPVPAMAQYPRLAATAASPGGMAEQMPFKWEERPLQLGAPAWRPGDRSRAATPCGRDRSRAASRPSSRGPRHNGWADALQQPLPQQVPLQAQGSAQAPLFGLSAPRRDFEDTQASCVVS